MNYPEKTIAMNTIVQQSFNATKYSLNLKQSMVRYDYKVAVQSVVRLLIPSEARPNTRV